MQPLIKVFPLPLLPALFTRIIPALHRLFPSVNYMFVEIPSMEIDRGDFVSFETGEENNWKFAWVVKNYRNNCVEFGKLVSRIH